MNSLPPVDVLLLTALKEEHDEARKVNDGAIGEWTEPLIDGFPVAFRSYRTVNGEPIRIALTWATRMGAMATADVAGRLIAEVSPRCLAMSGVCAGRRGKVHPGDVIIGSLLYSYDTGAKLVEYDGEGQRHERFQASLNPWPLDEQWLHRAQAFQVPAEAAWLGERPETLETQGNWLLARLRAGEDLLKHPERPQRCPVWKAVIERLRKLKRVKRRAPLTLTKAGRKHIDDLLLLHPDGLPVEPALRIHVAPIATGSNVMRDPLLFDRLSESMREVLGVEMEAAAIGAIAHSRELRWVVMKAAMDHADHDKDDQFKLFAARAAAECLIAFLRQNLMVDDNCCEEASPRAVLEIATQRPAPVVGTPGPTGATPFQRAGALRPEIPSYVTRPCDEELARALPIQPLIVLQGEFGIGKSSLLVRTFRNIERDGTRRVCHIDLQSTPTYDKERFHKRIFDDLSRVVGRVEDWRGVGDAAACRPLTILLDEFGHLTEDVAHQFLPGLCDLAQRSPAAVQVVVCQPVSMKILLRDKLHFDNSKYWTNWHPIEVRALDSTGMDSLLSLLPRPAQAATRLRRDYILKTCAGQPKHLQGLCFDLFAAAQRGDSEPALLALIDRWRIET